MKWFESALPLVAEDNELHETVVVPGADPWWTRTNILIENDYVDRIMSRYGLVTKTEAVDLALRHLAGDPMTLDEALAMRGAHAIDDLPAETPPSGTRFVPRSGNESCAVSWTGSRS